MKKNSVLLILTLVIIAAGILVTALGCNSTTSTSTNNVKVKATWISPEIQADTVAIPVGEIRDNLMTHFRVETSEGSIASMAYVYNDNIYVRSNICPPCRSIGFSLQGNKLVCDSCGTTFQAENGEGIAGACVNYPKASVQYQTNGDTIELKSNDIVSAYINTVSPGKP